VLRGLEAAHLVQLHGAGRYRMHDLVRLHATERALADQPPEERTAALRRLVDFYLHTAHAANRLIRATYRPEIELSRPADGCVPHPLPDQAAALAWLAEEHTSLYAAQQTASARGWHTQVWQLSWVLETFRDRRGLWRDQVVAWRLALDAAERLGDLTVQSAALQKLGFVIAQAGDTDEGFGHLYRALDLAERTGDATAQARTHHLLGGVWGLRGDDRKALGHARDSARLYLTLDEPHGEGQALNAVGWFSARLGDYAQARAACAASVELHRRHGFHAHAPLDSLGYVAYQTHDYHEALGHYREALAGCRATGDVYGEADVLDHVAEAHLALGRRDQARDTWHQALKLYQAQHRLDDADRVRRQLADAHEA
jgi:tetratricopeptide (TPR) repeat protein